MLTRDLSRRVFVGVGIRTSATLASLSLLPRPISAMQTGNSESDAAIRDPQLRALVEQGITVAKKKGAVYADIRLTYTKRRNYRNGGLPSEAEELHVGVRALVNGYWGVASSPVWGSGEMTRLAQEAVRQAKANVIGAPREIDWTPISSIANGHWETPVKFDAFQVHPVEIRDYLLGMNQKLENELGRLNRFGDKGKDVKVEVSFSAMIQERVFGSSEGAYCTQRIHRSSGQANCSSSNGVGSDAGLLTMAGEGWELFINKPVLETVRRNIQDNLEIARLPVKMVDVGRYDTVIDAPSVGQLLSSTVGEATEIDRALGYEANATGTSYLLEPAEMLGTYHLGTPLLTVNANRNELGGVASVKWDDEGVQPKPFTLVNNGVITDFHTSREGSSWLRSAYERRGVLTESNGCMSAETAGIVPAIRLANLVMQPGTASLSHADLEAGLDKGISIVGANPTVDFQLLSGYSGSIGCFEIKNGKRVARIAKAGIIFRTPELWKGLMAIGGAGASRRMGIISSKGEPARSSAHSVTAVPIVVKELTFIDTERR